MESQSKKNTTQIQKLITEIKLIKYDIRNIKTNHLKHLDYKITQIQRILWVVFAGVVANIIHMFSMIG
tara:strand:- start:312 stop:515 length:204 start_codon:yes stop_codon:yes gene_type:complete